MKLRKKIIGLIFILLLTNLISICFADAHLKKENTSVEIHARADENQLKMLNSMDIDNMSPLEIIQAVFPEEARKISTSQKQFMDTPANNFIAVRAQNGSSNIGYSRKSIKYSSKNDYYSPKHYVDSQLRNFDTDEIIEYEFAYDEVANYPDPNNYNNSDLIRYCKAEGIATPASGDYYVQGRHSWLYIPTGLREWTEMNRKSYTGSFHYVR